MGQQIRPIGGQNSVTQGSIHLVHHGGTAQTSIAGVPIIVPQLQNKGLVCLLGLINRLAVLIGLVGLHLAGFGVADGDRGRRFVQAVAPQIARRRLVFHTAVPGQTGDVLDQGFRQVRVQCRVTPVSLPEPGILVTVCQAAVLLVFHLQRARVGGDLYPAQFCHGGNGLFFHNIIQPQGKGIQQGGVHQVNIAVPNGKIPLSP